MELLDGVPDVPEHRDSISHSIKVLAASLPALVLSVTPAIWYFSECLTSPLVTLPSSFPN